MRSPVKIALLVAVLCGLALGNRAFAVDASAPPSLSAVQIHKLDGLLEDQGNDQTVPPVIMTRLGLAQRVVKQLGVINERTGDMHAYARLRDGGTLFTFIDHAKTRLAYTYRLDPNFAIVASVAMDKAVASEITDPSAGAKAELAYWAQVADQL